MMMKLINRTINLFPCIALPFAGIILKALKVDKFISGWGDMESMEFINMKNFIEFAVQWYNI